MRYKNGKKYRAVVNDCTILNNEAAGWNRQVADLRIQLIRFIALNWVGLRTVWSKVDRIESIPGIVNVVVDSRNYTLTPMQREALLANAA